MSSILFSAVYPELLLLGSSKPESFYRQRSVSPVLRVFVFAVNNVIPDRRRDQPQRGFQGRRCLPKVNGGVVAAGSSRRGERSPEARVWVIRLFLEELWQILKSPKEKVQLF